MRDILKYLLLAGGAYVAYRQFAAAPQTVEATPGTTSGSGGGSSTPPPAAPPAAPAAPALDLAAVMRAAAGTPNASDRLTFDTWNWYFERVRGVPGPAIEDVLPNTARGYLMTVDEWRAAVSKAGI